MQCLTRTFFVFSILSVLSACSLAPRGAALRNDILRESKQQDATYDIVPLNQQTVASIASWPATGAGIGLGWPGKGQSQPSRILRSGDTINLTIWDSQENSLLATPEQRAVPMNGLVIGPDGMIFVPYIEQVKIIGLSPEQARADIQSRLQPIAPSAQVQLAVVEGDNNSIELVSGVQRPGRYPVAARGVTILSMLAEGGGIPDVMRNPVVRLQRGGKSYAALAQTLYRSPDADILLRGGDRVIVESDPRRFVMLGATGSERSVPFEQASHSMLEALSLGSGLTEARANIRGVMVLRQYSAKAVRSDGSGPGKTQVVFTFDLSTGDGLFAARNFMVNPDDVILATESPLPATLGLLSLFTSSTALVQRIGG